MDICAVHMLGNKKTTIVRVVNREFAREALDNSTNLKASKRYGENTSVYINDSFCQEFKFLTYVIRRALREKRIHRYKIRNGVPYVQMELSSNFVEIGHVWDLENLKIPIPERK